MTERTNRKEALPDTSAPGVSTSAHEPTETAKGAAADSGAGGRNEPITNTQDADEALGNRTGGYGGNPAASRDQLENNLGTE